MTYSGGNKADSPLAPQPLPGFAYVPDAASPDPDRLSRQSGISAAQPQANAAGSTSPTVAGSGRTNADQQWQAAVSPSTLRTVALYALLALVSLVLAGGTFLLVASPADLIRDRLIAEVQSRTGRDLAVKGGASLALFPSFGVAMRDVELSAPPGTVSPPTLRAQTVTIHVAWWALMEGRVAVRALTLVRPVLDLRVDADGRRNWDFAAIEDRSPPVRLAQLAPRLDHGQGLPPELYGALEKSVSRDERKGWQPGGAIDKSLQEVRVTDGTIRYDDARASLKYEMSGVDLRIGRGAHGSIQISGSWALAGEKVAVEGEAQVHEAQPTKLALRASARPFEATWNGSVTLTSASADLDGRIVARASSTATLTRWLGKAAPSDDVDLGGAASVEGQLRASGATVGLSDSTITLNGTTMRGGISVELLRQRPAITVDLKLSEIDLDRYLGSGNQKPADEVPGSTSAEGSIGDLLRRTEEEGLPPGAPGKAQVRGFTRRIGGEWSAEPVEIGFLSAVDLAGTFEIGGLSWRRIVMGPTHASVRLDGGVLTAEVEGADFYGGRGRAVLSVHREGTGAFLGLTASVEDAAVLPLMRDAVGFEWVEGHGRLTLALTTTGASEREMAERLAGRALFKVRNGAVVGWSLAHILRKLRQLQLTALERDAEAKTPFHELSGSFTVAAGVATNQDLKMTGPTAALTGAGSIMLPQQTVDYAVHPRLTVATVAEGNAAEPMSVEIPVRIQGPWSKPKLTAETIQQLGRQLRSGNVEEAVKGLFGGGPEGEEKAAKAKEMLKRFLKQ
jgi:AsmA protein